MPPITPAEPAPPLDAYLAQHWPYDPATAQSIAQVTNQWLADNRAAFSCAGPHATFDTVLIDGRSVRLGTLTDEDTPGTLAATLYANVRLHSTTASRLGDLVADWLELQQGYPPSRTRFYADCL